MGKKALLIVDHGSKRTEANDMLHDVATMLREKSGLEIVYFAHMELVEPSIQQGFDDCVSAGAKEVIVHPYFLSPGKHSKVDIPRMVAEAAKRHPGVSFRVTEPLGLHPKIGDVIMDRVADSLDSRKKVQE